MHAILLIVFFLAQGPQVEALVVEPVKCPAARAAILADPHFEKVRAFCVYEADPT